MSGSGKQTDAPAGFDATAPTLGADDAAGVKQHDSRDSAGFEVLHNDDRALTVRELSEGHEYGFYRATDGGDAPRLAVGQCRAAAGRQGMDHFMAAARAFAEAEARRLRIV